MGIINVLYKSTFQTEHVSRDFYHSRLDHQLRDKLYNEQA